MTKKGNIRNLLQQFFKFAIVGIIAFVIDYGLMIILTELFHVPYLVSATISFITSVVFNYFASMRYVFTRKEGLSRTKEFVIFVILSVIGLILNDACMVLLVDFVHIDYRFAKIVATAMVTLWNFVTRKKFLDAGTDDSAKH